MVLLSADEKAPFAMKIISFYMVGSIMTYMILETSARYKGAYYSVLTLLAVYGYWRICTEMKERFFIKDINVGILQRKISVRSSRS